MAGKPGKLVAYIKAGAGATKVFRLPPAPDNPAQTQCHINAGLKPCRLPRADRPLLGNVVSANSVTGGVLTALAAEKQDVDTPVTQRTVVVARF